MWIVSYNEEHIVNCILQVKAESEEEAKAKAKNYMVENNIGYHYWEECFNVIRQKSIITIQ